jgi:hypothetical protein
MERRTGGVGETGKGGIWKSRKVKGSKAELGLGNFVIIFSGGRGF